MDVRARLTAAIAVTALAIGACEKGPTDPQSTNTVGAVVSPTYTLPELIKRFSPTDELQAAALANPERVLDSLYTVRFGVTATLPLTEAQVEKAVLDALGLAAMPTDIFDATRASRDLGLSSGEVAANVETVRRLYQNLISYRVYLNLAAVPTAHLSSRIAAECGPEDRLGANQEQLRLLALNLDKWNAMLDARNEAETLADEYDELGQEKDDTRANSFKHTMWNMLMVKYTGPHVSSVEDAISWTRKFATAQETGSCTPNSNASAMDLHNNEIGRNLIEPLAFRYWGGAWFKVATPDVAGLKSLAKGKADQAVFVSTKQQIDSRTNTLVFLRVPLTVNVAGSGSGAITTPAITHVHGKIDCQSSGGRAAGQCVGQELNQTLELKAAASSGSFAGWSGDCTGTLCIIAMDRPKTVTATFNVAAVSLTINASSNPSGGGTVAGTGAYPPSSSISLTAQPSSGYTFTRWLEDGSQISISNPLQFSATAPRSFVAVFTAIPQTTYSINLLASPANGGTVSGNGFYSANASVTVSASATAGFAFVRWTENGAEVSTNANYSFLASANRDLQAVFSQAIATTYNVGVSAVPVNGGSVSGIGAYGQNANVTVSATPASGFVFASWTENGAPVSNNPVYSFTAVASRTLIANFAPIPPTLYSIGVSVSPTNGGTVTGAGSYATGNSVTLTASAANGFSFVGWSEGGTQIATNSTYTFNAGANRNLVAIFTQNASLTYSIAVSASPVNGGSVVGGGTIGANITTAVIATPANGYVFTNWTENGNIVFTNATYLFTVTGNRNLVANFVPGTPIVYTITVSASPASGGRVSGGGSYNAGSSVDLLATAASGYSFVRWTENGVQVAASTGLTIGANANRALVAEFRQNAPQTYVIAVSASPVNGGSVVGGGSIDANITTSVIATPANGYVFTNWTENGNVVFSNATYLFAVTGNRNLVANFVQGTPIVYAITVSASPANGGTVSGGGSYTSGSSVDLLATAASGYSFVRWTENGVQVAASTGLTIGANANRALVAEFRQNTP